MQFEQWSGFKKGSWCENIDVRDFIDKNYTPYVGDSSFLAGATERTKRAYQKLEELKKLEQEAGGVLDIDTTTVSSLCNYAPGYLTDEDIIVGLQTDAPLKRGVNPFGGIRMARSACEAYGYKLSDKIEEYFDTLYANRYNVTYRLTFTDRPRRMALFVSKMSHCLYDILARYVAGEWDVEIPVIISNHPDLKSVADQFNIPYEVIPVTRQNKEEMEALEFEILDRYQIDFIVLARYMQVLSENFINRYPNRIINIHHSFLPAFVGAKPYHAAYDRGVKLIGATSHYVTTELDAGPIIEQDIVRITHKDTINDLVKKGRDLEKIVLSRAVEKHIQRKILTYNNKTVVFS